MEKGRLYHIPISYILVYDARIIKKYIDDVYEYGKFFGSSDGLYGSGGLMKGKKVMLSTTWNSPGDAFGGEFFGGASRDDVLLPMRLSQSYCGMDEMPHFSCHDVVTKPNFEADKTRYIKHLRTIFEIE